MEVLPYEGSGRNQSQAPPDQSHAERCADLLPQGMFFSTAITVPKANIQPKLPMPTTNISSINDQQQPTQNSP